MEAIERMDHAWTLALSQLLADRESAALDVTSIREHMQTFWSSAKQLQVTLDRIRLRELGKENVACQQEIEALKAKIARQNEVINKYKTLFGQWETRIAELEARSWDIAADRDGPEVHFSPKVEIKDEQRLAQETVVASEDTKEDMMDEDGDVELENV
ncbi:hypothetical protein BZG36_00299 [Bifiguratus adelaidae]|uniref:Uncharacterized protein n=1 Tax=Bifiguratus adelaidae TaxID=1938954 RepID=A0A261Y7P1_9FUNG|nr:hypothetical protein BZG36_00299 [Bifiguratus adelaidae]